MPDDDATLTIGVLSAATGVSATVLRSWEQRHGFPESTRTATGHRRYRRDAADRVAEVLRHRARGLSLPAAIDAVRGRSDVATPSFCDLIARNWPHQRFERLAPRTMLAFSRAIEEECCARADRPVVAAAFQTEQLYRRSEVRWRSIASTAAAAFVFADFAEPSPFAHSPVAVPIGRDSQTRREWVVICDAPERSACLIGRERLRAPHDAQRTFEATWSTEPAVVRGAVRLAVDLAALHDPRHAAVSELLRPPADDPTAAVRLAATLTGRLLAYLDAPTVDAGASGRT